MPCSWSRGGVPALGGGLLRGSACFQGVWSSGLVLLIEGGLLVESGLLLWPSDVIFCYGLLVRPSGMGLLTETFQPEGHIRRPYQNGLLVWPSGVIFCHGLLAMPCITPSPQQTATVADGTHPTGMHSFFLGLFPCFCFCNSSTKKTRSKLRNSKQYKTSLK